MRRLWSPDFAAGRALLTARAVGGSLGLVLRRPSPRSLRVARLALQVTPAYTMLSPARLGALYDTVQRADRSGIPGDVVECGTWHGGASAVMAAACRDDGWLDRRRYWLFDSFEGLPPPGPEDGASAARGFYPGWCKGDPDRARQAMAAQGVPPERVRIVPGWLERTLPDAELDRIAVLHLDVDWYDAVQFALAALYPKVSPGGYVVVDDYGKWSGCRKAVDQFVAGRRQELRLERPTRCSARLQKPPY